MTIWVFSVLVTLIIVHLFALITSCKHKQYPSHAHQLTAYLWLQQGIYYWRKHI